MLKERIELLCKKKQISRKDLVEGLVTQAHFANILAGRYPLADDLSGHIAGRLGVPVSYLTAAATTDEQALKRAEHIFQTMSGGAVSESYVDALDDRDDALVVELTTALMKAVYYQQINDQTAYDYLHQSYLNHYLEKYGKPDEVDLPLPLKKALLLYKIQYFRSKSLYYNVLDDVNRLIALVEPGTEVWLMAQNFRIVMLTMTGELEQALDEIARFEAMIANEPEETRKKLEPVTTIYRCEAAFAQKNWGLLSHGIERLRMSRTNKDQEMALAFYESQLALSQGDMERFQSLALKCLPYFESNQHEMRLEQLYEALAVVCEEGRRYKESSMYYRKLVYLLRNNGGGGPSRQV